MHVTSGYVWKSASCPHMPTLLMNYEWCWMRSKAIILFHISCLLLSLISIFTVYLICFLTLLLFMLTVQKWERTEASGSRTLLPTCKGSWQGPHTSGPSSEFIIHWSPVCFKYPLEISWAHWKRSYIYFWISLPSSLDLTLFTSRFNLSFPSHLHQHFCLLMNIWMRLKHWDTAHTHTHMLLLQRVAHNRGHKDFISSISCECLLTPLNSLLFLLWGLN